MVTAYMWALIGFGIFFVLVVVFGMLLGGAGAYVALILTILIVIILYRCMSGEKKAVREVMWYWEQENALCVVNGHRKCNKAIKVKKIVDYNLQYHPSNYVYTGATVGGVHVGGVHDMGNYYSVNGTNTEKYQLEYYGIDADSDKTNVIKKIILGNAGDPIREKARNDRFISQFLNEYGNIVLEHKINTEANPAIAAAIDANRTDIALQSMKQDYYQKQLTKEECERIVEWLKNVEV